MTGSSTVDCCRRSRGTFLLVLVAAGAGAVGAQPYGGGLILPVKVIAPGVMVMAIIYFMGTVSGAHLKPAVTWAFALRGNFPWRRVPRFMDSREYPGMLAEDPYRQQDSQWIVS
jgi:aquaporin Z